MSETKVSFEGSEAGCRLTGLLYRHATNRDVVVVCHGMFSTMIAGGVVPSVCSALSVRYSVLRFDFTGNGWSDGEFSYARYDREVSDISRAVQYLRDVERLNPICVVGHSKGGCVALMHAANGTHGRELPHVSIAGKFTYGPGTEAQRFTADELRAIEERGEISWRKYNRQWTIAKAAIDERQRLGRELPATLSHVKSKVLHVHGSADELVPLTDADFVCEHVPGGAAEKVVIDGANHYFTGREVQLAHCIAGWVAKAKGQ